MLQTTPARRPLFFIAVALLLAGCRGPNAAPAIPAASLSRSPVARHAGGIDKIQHVVIVVQENRSFNNLFYGFPGAKTVTYGLDSKNQKITLKPVGLATSWDIEHSSGGYYAACNGTGKIPGTHCRMNGFDKETWTCPKTGKNRCPIEYPPYSYVPHDESAPYFSMAKQYVLADQMYASNFDSSSYVSHQYIISGQAGMTTDYPGVNWGCPGGKTDTIWTLKADPPRAYDKKVTDCFNYRTVGDELDDAGGSWAFYATPLGKVGPGGTTCGSGLKSNSYVQGGIWSSYQAVKHICYGPDWDRDVFYPPQQFLTDVSNGQLRDVTWITPYCKNSDHPGCSSDTGPSWVTSVVNAVGTSKFWKSTVIFIFWDDYGGFYDPEAPTYKDYDGLGIRIPLLIISPYAKKGWVSHVHYEHGSILKFIEDRFHLAPLAESDKRAASLTKPGLDCFDFSKPPREFVPIQSKYDTNFFVHQTPDYRPPDTD
ncbi:MAG TPA: alkaline phosphatase family protein [Candidatus Cybelea sp.]|jgi:phospholipase C